MRPSTRARRSGSAPGRSSPRSSRSSVGSSGAPDWATTPSSGTCAPASRSSITASRTATCSRTPPAAPRGSRSRGSPKSPTPGSSAPSGCSASGSSPASSASPIAVLAYRLAVRLSGSWLRGAGIAGVSTAGLFAMWSERPLVLGVLFLLVLLWVVEVPDSWVGRHALVVVPVVLWLWVERPRLVRARARVPGAPRPRALVRRRTAVGRTGAHARVRHRASAWSRRSPTRTASRC